MRVYFVCNNCFLETRIPGSYTDRFDLAARFEKPNILMCKYCNAPNQLNINRVFTKLNFAALFSVFIVLSVVSGLIAFHYYELFVRGRSLNIALRGLAAMLSGFVPIAVFLVFVINENKRVKLFNNSRV